MAVGLTWGWSLPVVQFSFQFAGRGCGASGFVSPQCFLLYHHTPTFPMWKKEKMCACVVLVVVATQLYILLFWQNIQWTIRMTGKPWKQQHAFCCLKKNVWSQVRWLRFGIHCEFLTNLKQGQRHRLKQNKEEKKGKKERKNKIFWLSCFFLTLRAKWWHSLWLGKG